MVFIADDLLYYYNDSRLIKKENNLAANSHKDNYYKGNGGWGANAKRDPGFYKQNAWIKEVLGKGLKCKCLLPTSQDELLIEFSANTCVPY